MGDLDWYNNIIRKLNKFNSKEIQRIFNTAIYNTNDNINYENIILEGIDDLDECIVNILNNVKILETTYFNREQNVFLDYDSKSSSISMIAKHAIDKLENIELQEIDSNYTIIQEYVNAVTEMSQVINSIKNIPLFNELFGSNQSVLIIGENGSGKSTLVNDIKKDRIQNMCVIPAQKNLIFVDNEDVAFNKKTIDGLLKESYLKYESVEYIVNDNKFSNLIHFLKREHQSKKADSLDGESSKLDELNGMINLIFPEIRLKTDSLNGTVLVERQVNENTIYYPINKLSDGERSAILYIIYSILANPNSIIVIDEPETHLHDSISLKLWSLITDKRKDCKFIFISHNPNLISSVDNVRMIWCKKYKSIDDYDIQLIENNNIPKELIVQIMGSKKDIIFCEGNYESLDYQIYSILYSDKFFVKPVGGMKK